MGQDGGKGSILEAVSAYHDRAFAPRPFVPGSTPVPVSGRVFGAPDLVSLVEAALDFWLTAGPFNDRFEAGLAEFLGARSVLTVNSGSSANLLAFAALTSPLLKDRALKPGDEVLTVAAGFPTTVNPILLHGCVPVFVDIELGTYNALPGALEAALTPRTRAVVLAHTLGNPFDAGAVAELARRKGLWFVEDCCDALGSTLGGRQVGSFGHLGTLSFYPAHHITTGEGGAVFTSDPVLAKAVESLRDWGRDCWCAPGHDDTCGRRYGWEWEGLPRGYDHKYVYSHLGYNLKMTDLQAAVGVAQLARLEEFGARRRENFRAFLGMLQGLEEVFILPRATPGSDPSWFGFPLTLREGLPFTREDLLRRLQEAKVGARLLFGGNLTRQPYMKGRAFRTAGPLEASDKAMRDTFWTGVFPGLTPEMLAYSAGVVADFVRGRLG